MSNDSTVWIERFRPEEFEEILGRNVIVKRLDAYVKTGEMPHLLFSGWPGTGKTTAAGVLGKKLFGEDFDDNFTELNASDERGIDVVRGRVTNTAETMPSGNHDFRIIFLDEADALTSDAQSALRRTMEKNTNNCRFILSCNYVSKIIPPIQSRCSIYRFGRLEDEAIKSMVNYIVKHEKLEIKNDAIVALTYVAEGDMRKAINTLQAASLSDGLITSETIYEISGFAQPKFIEEMIELAFKGKFLESRNKLDILLVEEGFAGGDVIYQVHKKLLEMALPDKLMIEMAGITGEVDFRVSEGANDKIQLDALLAWFAKVGSDNK
jgi:replication factor C small subunit